MRFLVPVLLTAACLAPCVAQAQTQAPGGDAPVVGMALPLTGEYGPVGRQLAQAGRMAAAEKHVELVVEDTAGTPQGAARAVAALAARPRVVAVVGPIGRRESRTAASVAARASLPLFVLSSAEEVNTSSGWVFRVRPSPAEQAARLADVARGRLGSKRAAILFPKTAYGRSAAVAFAKAFASAGGSIAAVANYPEDMTDFRDVLEVIVGQKVYLGHRARVGKWRADAHGFARIARKPRVDFDTLFIPDFAGRVARILGFLPGAGIQNGEATKGVAVQLLGLAGWQGKAMELAGETAAGAAYLDLFVGEAMGGRQESFSRAFEEKFGRRPVDAEAQAFDAVWLLSTIAGKLKSVDAGARATVVRSVPRKKPFSGICGPMAFGTHGEPILHPHLYEFDADGLVSPSSR